LGLRYAHRPVIAAYGAVPVQRLTKKDIDELVPLLTARKLLRSTGKAAPAVKVPHHQPDVVRTGQHAGRPGTAGMLVCNVVALVDRLPPTKQEMQTYTPAEVKTELAAAGPDRLEPV
jgi:hypothetical protein